MHSAVQTAEIVAGILGLEVLVREGLRECGVGGLPGSPGDEAAIDGGERIGDVILRMGTILMEVADQHRGEAALVVSHGRAILATVPHLVGLPPAPARSKVLPCGGRVGLEYDSDGWRLA